MQGAALGGVGLLAGSLAACRRTVPLHAAAQDLPGYYPPRLTGLRGSHPGSFEAAHLLRDGHRMPEPIDLGEDYDLVVVGAGISGLSTAHFYLEAHPNARVLLLDNHDDFGGHAKRNEFEIDGQMRLLNGGTYAIESPRPYSSVADGVLRAIGIDAPTLAKTTQKPDVYPGLGLSSGIFFDERTFGRDQLVAGYGTRSWTDFLRDTPLSEAARRDVERVETSRVDPMPGLTSDEKKRRLLTISYRNYLKDVLKVDERVLDLYQARTQGWWGVGIDAVCALDCWGSEMPGFQGLKLEPGDIPGMGYTPGGFAATGGSVFVHFPDGNATVARGLVRRLIPAAVPGSTIEDLVTARVDYRQLDRAGAPVRLRLSSPVVAVHHDGEPGRARAVRIGYMRDGKVLGVRAKHCVLACYHALIPYLMPELPAAQKAAMHLAVKTPLVYTSVAIRNWQAFSKLGVHSVYAPGSYHSTMRLNLTVDVGDYQSPRHPEDPTLISMTRTPCMPGFTEFEQNKIGRAELYATPFETFEFQIRDQLARVLGPGGFDPARDITAITVNRWPHGYSPEHNPLFDPLVPETERNYYRARARFHRVAFANADAGAGAYTDVAIDQAHRAVSELLGA
jgi:spermidine dehydrogenase